MPNTPLHSSHARTPVWRHPATMIAVVALAWCISLYTLPKDGFWIVDNGVKFIQVQALVRNDFGDFWIPWSGYALDPKYRFNPLPPPMGFVHDGKLFGPYSNAFALLSTLPYRWWGYTGLHLIPLLGGLLLLPGIWMLTRATTAQKLAPPLAVLLAGLCTPIWFYSNAFWEHTPALCLNVWTIIFLAAHLRAPRVSMVLPAGVCCGLAIYFRDELYIFTAIIGAMFFGFGARRWRDSLLFVAAFAVSVAPLWAFQWWALGNPLGHHFGANPLMQHGLTAHLLDRFRAARFLLVNITPTLWLSLTLSLPFLALWLAFPRLRARTQTWMLPVLGVFASVLGVVCLFGHLTTDDPVWWIGRSNALFTAAPLLIYATLRTRAAAGARAAGARILARTPPTISTPRLLWLIVTAYILIWLAIAPVKSSRGVHWGSRFLLLAYPIMSVLAAAALARAWRVLPSGGVRRLLIFGPAATAILTSFAIQIHGLRLLHWRKAESARTNDQIAKKHEPIVIADRWGVPPDLARVFYDKTIFLVQDRAELPELLAILQRHHTPMPFLMMEDPPQLRPASRP